MCHLDRGGTQNYSLLAPNAAKKTSLGNWIKGMLNPNRSRSFQGPREKMMQTPLCQVAKSPKVISIRENMSVIKEMG